MESYKTDKQYINTFKLDSTSVILDLGSFSGLTSILFCEELKKKFSNFSGRIITLEPDNTNFYCAKYNIDKFNKLTNSNIELLNYAIWSDDVDLDFSSEGMMGSSAISIVGDRLCKKTLIHAIKLSSLARLLGIKKIDLIKCDIDGAEIEIFKDREFFLKYHPNLIIEPHLIANVLDNDIILKYLSSLDYKFKVIKQQNYNSLPLIIAY